MIKNSLFHYISIRIAIAALRLIAPLSIVYVPCGFLNWLQLPWIYNILLIVYTTAEAAFYLLVYLPRRRKLQAPPVHTPPSLTRAQRQRIFDKCIEADRLHSSLSTSTSAHRPGRPYPSGWFLPADSTPTRNDAIDWLLWALFSTSREAGIVDLNEEGVREEMDGYIERIEKAIGQKLEGLSDAEEEAGRRRMDEETGRQRESGQRDKVRSMRITLDPVQMLHRPLLWYFIVCLVDTYTTIILLSLGFKHYTPRSREYHVCFPPRPILSCVSKCAPPGVVVPYWHRPHRSKTKMPVVFLHGIGIGLYPYIPFIRKLFPAHLSSLTPALHDEDMGVLLPELLPISMHMTPLSVPPRAEMLRSLDLILEELKTSDVQHPGSQGQHEHDEVHDERRPLLRASSSTSSSSSSSYDSLPTYRTHTPSPSSRSLSCYTDVYSQDNDTVLDKNQGWDRVVLVAHSYGTFIAGWIIRTCVDVDFLEPDDTVAPSSSSVNASAVDTPETVPASNPPAPTTKTPVNLGLAQKIAHMVLVDPIPILLSDPTVAHNFLYREPGTVCPVMLGSVGGVVGEGSSATDSVGVGAVVGGELLGQSMHGANTNDRRHTSLFKYYSSAAAWQLWYFASRDADVARTLCRAFFWAEGGVWRDEVEEFVSGAGSRVDVDTEDGPTRSTERGRKRNMAVFLGGMDQIVPAEAIRRHLTKEARWTERWAGRVSGQDGVVCMKAAADDGGSATCSGAAECEEEEEVVRVLHDSESPTLRGDEPARLPSSRFQGRQEGMLEVLFNPVLDHAVIFDEERYTEPLVEVVQRYVGER